MNGPLDPPAACPSSDVDLWAPDTLRDPYPAYRELRDLGGVVWLDRYGLFALPRFDIVRSVLTNWKQFSSASGVGMQPLANEHAPRSIIKSDPPVHDDFRRPIAAQLSNSSLAKDTGAIERVANRLLDDIVSRVDFDGVTDLARPFSLDVVCDLAGIPEHCRAQLPLLAEQAFNLFGPDNNLLALAPPALGRMRAEILELANVNGYEPGGRAAELVTMNRAEQVLLYTWPGIDTTVNGIGSALYLFAVHPDQWDLVRQDQSLVPSAFAEALRMHTPVHYFTRITTEPVEIDGVAIPQQSRLLVMYGSANRDERRYQDPDRFDVTRNPTDQLAFGRGIHLCVGANLAKLEGHVLLAAMARRVEGFRLAGAPEWLVNNTLHGLTSLPLTVDVM